MNSNLTYQKWNEVLFEKATGLLTIFYIVKFPWRHPRAALVMTAEYMRRSGYVKYKADKNNNDNIKRQIWRHLGAVVHDKM